jgi:DNA-binding CsgD family transcriptional regulator
MLSGFRESANTMIGAVVTRNGFTVRGLCTTLTFAQKLEENGYGEEVDALLDIARDDLHSLDLDDLRARARQRVELVVDGKTLKLIAADDDAAEPTVKLHLLNPR